MVLNALMDRHFFLDCLLPGFPEALDPLLSGISRKKILRAPEHGLV